MEISFEDYKRQRALEKAKEVLARDPDDSCWEKLAPYLKDKERTMYNVTEAILAYLENCFNK